LLGRVQADVIRGTGTPLPAMFSPSPAPFLPVFIVPLQIFALVRPSVSFLMWTLINLCSLIAYLFFFWRRISGEAIPRRVLLILLLSFPSFANLYWGQINLWLMICIGEFIRATLAGKQFHAGLWLAGLLLKPQTLILIIPALLIQKSWKILAGFSAASAFTGVISLLLGGAQALINLAALWLNYAHGLATNAPEQMMNWRMVGLHLSAYLSPQIAWTIAMAGLILTALVALSFWVHPVQPGSMEYHTALLGTFAATGIVTWHSHLHMAMILMPCLILLSARGSLSQKLIAWWAFLPTVTLLSVLCLGALMILRVLPVILGLDSFMKGCSGLIANLIILDWAFRSLRKDSMLAYQS
jgi:hypothetical protein